MKNKYKGSSIVHNREDKLSTTVLINTIRVGSGQVMPIRINNRCILQKQQHITDPVSVKSQKILKLLIKEKRGK